MDDLIIRSASADDFESVNNFINALENESMDIKIQRAIYMQNLQNPDIIYLLAEKNKETIGFLSCHIQNLLHHGGAVGEIQEMFVVPEMRSLGIGKLLIDSLKELAKAKKLIQLEVTSSFKRESAHEFYLREGFNFTHKKFVFK